MKLNKTLVTLSALALGLVLATGSNVKAADETATDTTNATVVLGLGTDAAVTITKAPTFDFGTENVVSLKDQTLQAPTITDGLSVVNPGLTTGWHVSVAASDFTNSEKTQTLKGAVLTLVAGQPASQNNAGAAPTVPSASLALNSKATPILTAAANAGIGTWNTPFEAGTSDDAKTTLLIPGGSASGSYSSTLTWTVGNTPA